MARNEGAALFAGVYIDLTKCSFTQLLQFCQFSYLMVETCEIVPTNNSFRNTPIYWSKSSIQRNRKRALYIESLPSPMPNLVEQKSGDFSQGSHKLPGATGVQGMGPTIHTLLSQ